MCLRHMPRGRTNGLVKRRSEEGLNESNEGGSHSENDGDNHCRCNLSLYRRTGMRYFLFGVKKLRNSSYKNVQC